MRYFAYGSNMSVARLRERAPSAEVVGVARLRQHQLRFHKVGTDGSGKCNIWRTGKGADVVFGVIYELDDADRPALDAAENLGTGYEIHTVELELDDAGVTHAEAYVAIPINDDLAPFDWYHALVVAGAREHQLPEAYIQDIEAQRVFADRDRERAHRHYRLLDATWSVYAA
ncbi:MAG: gamma-glutamylcyclotransferase [Gammaproteobacteria bacterium]|nr:gamma-glutamylcyclotransferase [Gammaproteobacteria bacterium]